jgi:hypothetical protein
MAASQPWRIDLEKRAHAFAVAALIEALIVALLLFWANMMIGGHSILPLAFVVLFTQAPTSLVVLGLFPLLPEEVELGTAITIGAVILFLGQTLFLGWWMNFRARKASWDPSAV